MAKAASPIRPGPAAPIGGLPRRALGRSLADFGALSPAERKLLDCCRKGEPADIGEQFPDKETRSNRVRADFVRFLALGGDDQAPVHERGVMLDGAWLTGELCLEAASIERRLMLTCCTIQKIVAHHTSLKYLGLPGSRLLDGLDGTGLRCEGDVDLRFACSTGEIRLYSAAIGGNLVCDGGTFENAQGAALFCDGLRVMGSVFLRAGFCALGQVRLLGARIDNALECVGGRFENDGGRALSCDGAIISGNVLLRDGFHASAGVYLPGAEVGGDLDCTGATIEIEGGTTDGDAALSLDRTQVAGAFFFQNANVGGGGILLASLQVAVLCDDSASWKRAEGQYVLDGFTYARLTGDAPTRAQERIAWIEDQYSPHVAEDFKPQPWEQAIAVLRAMGNPNEARLVAIAKQQRLRRTGNIPKGVRSLHWFYGMLVGYGYRPMRLLVAIATVWLGCAAAYWAAANPARFGSETYFLAPPPTEPGRAPPQADYANFVPLIYSADVLLPVVDLGYKKEWQPVVLDRAGKPLIWGRLLRFLYWFEIAFGWVAGLLLVGVLGNLIKKD
jgi:hypothetical protein